MEIDDRAAIGRGHGEAGEAIVAGDGFEHSFNIAVGRVLFEASAATSNASESAVGFSAATIGATIDKANQRGGRRSDFFIGLLSYETNTGCNSSTLERNSQRRTPRASPEPQIQRRHDEQVEQCRGDHATQDDDRHWVLDLVTRNITRDHERHKCQARLPKRSSRSAKAARGRRGGRGAGRRLRLRIFPRCW